MNVFTRWLVYHPEAFIVFWVVLGFITGWLILRLTERNDDGR